MKLLSEIEMLRLFEYSPYLGFKICGTYQYTRAQTWNPRQQEKVGGGFYSGLGFSNGDILINPNANKTNEEGTCSDRDCSEFVLLKTGEKDVQ